MHIIQNRIWSNWFLILAVFIQCPAFSQTHGLLTNLELFEREISVRLDTLLSVIPFDTDTQILIEEQGNQPSNWLVKNILTSKLIEKDKKIFQEQNETITSKTKLTFNIGELSVQYPKCRRKNLFGPRIVDREMRLLVFFLMIRENDGLVLWSGKIKGNYSDKVPFSKLKFLQGGLNEPQNNEITDKGIPLLEPLVVGGVILGLIYLFFMQSD